MIRAVSALLILWGCAFAQAPLEITSSTPMGMPCGGISTLGCMPDAQCGWMVVVRTGDAAAFAGKLTYADAEGREQTATVTAAATGEYTALAFRVGVFRATGNRFVAVEVSALKAFATVRQDAEGAIITVGETIWGPPKQARWTDSGINGPPPETLSDLAKSLATQTGHIAWRTMPHMVWAYVTPDGMKIEQSPLDLHAAPIVGESLSCNLCSSTVRTIGDPAQSTTNLKEYHQ